MRDPISMPADVSGLLQQLTGAGVFEWGLRPDAPHRWSPTMRSILGVADDAPAPGPADFIARFVAADDADRIARAVQAVTAGASPVDLELKASRADGTVRTLRVILARGMRGDSNVPILKDANAEYAKL